MEQYDTSASGQMAVRYQRVRSDGSAMPVCRVRWQYDASALGQIIVRYQRVRLDGSAMPVFLAVILTKAVVADAPLRPSRIPSIMDERLLSSSQFTVLINRQLNR
jgi:hypothetical protein